MPGRSCTKLKSSVNVSWDADGKGSKVSPAPFSFPQSSKIYLWLAYHGCTISITLLSASVKITSMVKIDEQNDDEWDRENFNISRGLTCGVKSISIAIEKSSNVSRNSSQFTKPNIFIFHVYYFFYLKSWPLNVSETFKKVVCEIFVYKMWY